METVFMNHPWPISFSRAEAGIVLCIVLIGLSSSCVRLPNITEVVYEDARVLVTLQRDVEPQAYSHPAEFGQTEMMAILEGFSFRPKQRMPVPPKPVFHQDELEILTRLLPEGLQIAGPGERVHFELRAPGFAPNEERDVVAGWVAVREPYFYLTLEYEHVQVPTHEADPNFLNYPTPPPPPTDYLLYFEPESFWVADQRGVSALDYRAFLNDPKSVASPIQ
jgi:hypothetical protein